MAKNKHKRLWGVIAGPNALAERNDQINNLGGLIVRVIEFHSKRKDIVVYHNNNKCTEGNNIEPYNYKRGTGGKRLCERCKKLNREGK